MAVSKRTRYEVLRRDNHTCRYCGASAPDVSLTVDHVMPTALGGSDAPDNLVAACRDCNAGKTSTNPDEPLVADVSQDALRYAAAAIEANRRFLARMEEAERYTEYCLDGWMADFGDLPDDAGPSFRHWHRRGVPLGVIDEGLRIAQEASDSGRLRRGGEWKYFCGVVWNLVRELGEETRKIYEEAGRDGA